MQLPGTRLELLRAKAEALQALYIVRSRQACETSLATFVREAWPIVEPGTELLWNWHLDTICGYLEAVYERRITRLIFNVPPGSCKSLLVAVFYPAWVWAKRQTERFLCVTNELELATRDAIRQKNLIESEWYRERWIVDLKRDQNEKTHYANTRGGHRQAVGMNANITGKRSDSLIIDDPADAKRAFSEVDRKSVLMTYDQKLSTRLNHQDRSAIILIQQRLHVDDLTGHLLKKTKTRWTHVCIPMEYDGPRFDAGRDIGRPELNDPRKKDGELLHPRLFSATAVAALKEDLGVYGASGQLQQSPVPEGGGILKSTWWRIWPEGKGLPEFEHIFLSWDTAYTEKDLKDVAYSGHLGFGIFWDEQEQRHAIMLMRAWYSRVEYPELRRKAKEITVECRPDAHLIEKKASGISLVQDMRRIKGVRVRTYQPDRDKIARAYAVSAMLESGQVWAPDRKWADAVINYIAEFPNGSPPSADLCDMLTQALLYLRNGFWVSHPDDDDPPPTQEPADEDDAVTPSRRGAYG